MAPYNLRGSWYSQLPAFGWFDAQDRPNSNALGVPDSQQGIALPSRRTLGQWFNVTPPGGDLPFPMRQTDTGPAPWTGRGVDISAAGAHQMGYTPKNFPTDANFKVEPIDLTGLGLAAGWSGGGGAGTPDNAEASASGPGNGGKRMPNSLMDMLTGDLSPRDAGGQPASLDSAIAGRSNSLIGLGLGLLQPRSMAVGAQPQSAWSNALGGYMQGAQTDAQQAYRQQVLQHQKQQDARQAAMDKFNMGMREREFARSGESDFAKYARDLGLAPGSAEYGEAARKWVMGKMEGEWDTKDIIDPSNPDEKITIQQHKRTGELRYPTLPGQTAAGPATNWSTGAGNAPVYGEGAGGFSQPPSAPPAAGAARPPMSVTMPNGQVLSPPPGLTKDGRKAWTNHIATTAADVSSGKMTEAQGTSNLFAGKMQIANSMLDPETEKKGLDPLWNRVERYGGWAGNTLALPNDYKAYRDAKDAFLNAFLRRVSGATVHDAEYYREEKVYFPQPGDDESRIEFKRRLRADAIMRMKAQVGPGYTEPPAPPGRTAPAAAGNAGGIPPPPPGFNIVR